MEQYVQFYMVKGKGPKWKRSAGIAEDGTVYVPAAIGGDEHGAFLCASFDGTRACINYKHVFLPSEWMKKEYPKSTEVIDLICRRMRESTEGT